MLDFSKFIFSLSRLACMAIVLMMITVACGRGQNHSVGMYSPAATNSDGLVSLMRYIGAGYDYEHHDSPAILGNNASLTVIGTVSDVSDGRVFGVGKRRETEPAFLNLTYTVQVESVLGGDQSLQ